MTNTFHPWEGEEGKISTQYKIALIQMTKEDIVKERYEKAIECLKKLTMEVVKLQEQEAYEKHSFVIT